MPPVNAPGVPLNVPVQHPQTPEEPTTPQPGIALCLSGGGYRAMLFHIGCLLRLNEAGLLGKVKRVSSVSGGSITAGVLAMQWHSLQFADGSAPPKRLLDQVVAPLRDLASRTIDIKSVVGGILLPGVTIADRVASAYDKYLFKGKTLQEALPDDSSADAPRFVINATNVQTGSLWRFSRPFMADYQVGKWSSPAVRLAVAVAASSAFPPVLSPLFLEIETAPDPLRPDEPSPPCRRPPFTTHAVLSDGGVYDNLGLETAFKHYKTLLVSDGGMKMSAEPEPAEDWALHSKRILDVIDNQVRSLRKRQLIESFVRRDRSGTYWGITTKLQDYGLLDGEEKPDDPFGYLASDRPEWKNTIDLAATPTRLAAMESWRQEALINWGYAICDTALRSRTVPQDLRDVAGVDIKLGRRLPYPEPK